MKPEENKLPYYCPICDKFFLAKDSLTNHLESQIHKEELKKRRNR